MRYVIGNSHSSPSVSNMQQQWVSRQTGTASIKPYPRSLLLITQGRLGHLYMQCATVLRSDCTTHISHAQPCITCKLCIILSTVCCDCCRLGSWTEGCKWMGPSTAQPKDTRQASRPGQPYNGQRSWHFENLVKQS